VTSAVGLGTTDRKEGTALLLSNTKRPPRPPAQTRPARSSSRTPT
jgi:hypothetical protein